MLILTAPLSFWRGVWGEVKINSVLLKPLETKFKTSRGFFIFCRDVLNSCKGFLNPYGEVCIYSGVICKVSRGVCNSYKGFLNSRKGLYHASEGLYSFCRGVLNANKVFWIPLISFDHRPWPRINSYKKNRHPVKGSDFIYKKS